MKRIFTKRYAMAAGAVIMALTTTFCTKTDELSGGKENTVTTIGASIGGTKAEASLVDGTKVNLTDNDDGTNHTMIVTWKTGDVINLFNGKANSSTPTAYTLSEGDGTKYAKFSTSGSFSPANGDQIYAIYAPWSSSNWVANGQKMEVVSSAAAASLTSPMTNTSLNKYSLMYAGTKFTTGNELNFRFTNAMAMVKVTLPASGQFQDVRVYSADGSMYNTATITLSGGGTDGTTPDIKWSNKGDYGARALLDQTSDVDFGGQTLYFTMIPQASREGMVIAFLKGGTGTSATDVYYVMLTGTDPIEGGKYYTIPASAVKQGGIVDSRYNAPTSDFWYAGKSTTEASEVISLNSLLNGISSSSRRITVINEMGNTTAGDFSTKTALQTYIDDNATTINGFNGCTNLKYVSIPNVTDIPAYAFNSCSSLKSLCLPSVTSVSGTQALGYCTSLTKLTFRKILTDANWSSLNIFRGTTTSKIDLVLKSGQTDNGGAAITGTKFHGVTFKSITLED